MSSLSPFKLLPLVMLLLPSITECTLGVDVSQLTSTSQFNCMKASGCEQAIVRAYRSTGNPDPNAVKTLVNAHSAQMETVDVYMFPCPKCSKTATNQVNEMGEYIMPRQHCVYIK